MIAKASREETNGSEGIEVVVNERFKTDTDEGIYTHKIIHLSQYAIESLLIEARKSHPNQILLIGASLLGLARFLGSTMFFKSKKSLGTCSLIAKQVRWRQKTRLEIFRVMSFLPLLLFPLLTLIFP